MDLVSTVGAATANSYVEDVEEAEEILAEIVGDELKASWTDISEGRKTYFLVMAAMLMQYLPWRGSRVYDDQRLACPRDCQTDTAVIWSEVKQVQSFIAYSLPDNAAFMPLGSGAASPSGSDISSFSLGGLLSVGFSQSQKSSGNVLTEMTKSPNFPIYILLSPLLAQIRGWSVRTLDEMEDIEDEMPEL